MSRDCPEKKKPKCHNCGGPHTLDKCDAAHWDTDRIFESKRQEKERFAKRHQPEEVRPVASITIKVTDLKGTAATIDTYDSVLDAVPEALSTTYISATEGFKLGYGSDIEAEGAEAKAKNAVIIMSMPTVKIITQRAREPNSGSAHNTPQKSSNGTTPGSGPPSTPRTELFPSPHSSSSSTHGTATSPASPAPWAQDLSALENRVNTSITEVKQEQAELKATVDGVRATQQADGCVLKLMSIRMGLAEPDPDNPMEMRAAEMARKSTMGGAPPPPPPPPDTSSDDMEHSEDKKRKARESAPTVDTRWIILGPGEPPQHADTWVQFRVIIKEQRADGTWLLQLVNAENTNVGNPFTTTKPSLYKSQEEADAALSARLAGVRER